MEEELDAKVAAVLDAHSEKAIAASKESGKELSEDEDDLLEELERDEALDAFREKRLQQLHDELARARRLKDQYHGSYREVTAEKEAMEATTSSKYSVIHFFHSDFRRCKIMDAHLEVLAQKHFDTKILKINVENAPFLVERLHVRVLPCVISFIEGKSVDRLEGFEKLGSADEFSTATLEAHFIMVGIFQRPKTIDDGVSKGILRTEKKVDDNDDDDDWD
ncbi:thioredoxin-like protein [Kalaharituber pfeilii]|nr:thioredoxin-like protein [Kalaharituber pfeilii]